jgi:hypothetical protein
LHNANGNVRATAMTEKRIAPRHRVFKHGVLAFSAGGSVDCTVRNVSATGARIDVASPIGLPKSFVLLIETDHFSRHCHSVWSRDKQIGVAFD